MANSRIEAVMEHLTYTKGVVGVVLCNIDGVPLRDSFQNLDRTVALQYTEMASALARQAALLYRHIQEDPIEAAKRNAHRKQTETERELDDFTQLEEDEEDIGGKAGLPNSLILDDAHNPVMKLFNDELEGIRIRTRTNEIVIQCKDEYLVVVVQEV